MKHPIGWNQYSDTPSATHCINGHEFTKENTYINPDGWRICKTCSRKSKEKWAELHKEETVVSKKNYASNHPERRKKSTTNYARKRQGFTLESFDAKLKEQCNKCAICGDVFTEKNVPHGDHKHVLPPQPRGALCNLCNLGLGAFRDSIINLKNAEQYLIKYGEV